MTKKLNTVWVSDLFINLHTLDEVAKNVQAAIALYGPDATVHLQVDDYKESASTEIYVKREETDAEYKHRLEWEQKQEKSRRAQYEELKKEFEG